MPTEMTNIDVDAASRNSIVSDIYSNFFVEAGAGSGKTTMLVNRMVAMVEAGIDIKKICAITFTKAAANEFYSRFQKILIERSNPDFKWVDKGYAGQLPAPTEESRKRCEAALKDIDLCFMGTIDSFCSMVISEHPTEARIPSDSSIISEDDAEVLYKQIYVDICEGKYGTQLRDMSQTFRAVLWNAEEVFVQGIAFFMGNRNVKFKFDPADAVVMTNIYDVDALYAADKAAICNALSLLLQHPEIQYDNNGWDKIDDALRRLKGKWSRNITGIVSALHSIESVRTQISAWDMYGATLSECFDRHEGNGYYQWLEFSPTKEGKLMNKLQNLNYGASMPFLMACVPVVEQVMRDKGTLTYFDYLYYLRNMLKADAEGDGELIKYIYGRHSYFLIDEFQDTNPMQAEIFFYLAAKKPVAKWRECVPKEGSLFVVGDPKQSIYRFRSADVTSFLDVKKLFQQTGGKLLYLSRNFRSTKTMLEHFNSSFTNMLPKETEIQSKFESIPLPAQDREEFVGVYTYEAYTGKILAEKPLMADEIQLTKVIKALVGRKDCLVAKDGETPHPIRYRDIMIITPSKAKIDKIVPEFEQAGIPMHVEGRVPFKRNEALIQIASIYRAVADIDINRYLYSALISKLVGLTDKELMRYVNAGGVISLKKYRKPITEEELKAEAEIKAKIASDPVAAKVGNCIDRLKILADKAKKLSPAALFSEIMDSYEIYRVVPTDNLEVLYYTLELLRSEEKSGGVVSLMDGANYIDMLLTTDNHDIERCLSLNDSKDCVHIANLHKIKGLEAPIVILSGAFKFADMNVTSRVVHSGDESEGYLFSLDSPLVDFKSYSYFKTNKYDDEKAKESAAINAEKLRQVYVAATRARNVLIISDTQYATKTKMVHSSAWTPVRSSSARDIFKFLVAKDSNKEEEKEPEIFDAASLYNTAKNESVLNSRSAEEKTFVIQNPSHAKITSKMDDEEIVVLSSVADNNSADKSSETKKSFNVVHKFPDLLGTMTHRLMEIIVSTRNTSNIDQTIDEIIREYRSPKYQQYEKNLAEALKTVADTMLNGGYSQENGVAQDILKVLFNADEVHCEVPFCYKDEHHGEVTLWNGIMDVIYCENGKWHIIDYKTNLDGNELDKKYEAQLEAYKKALKATIGEDADAYTYHIDI